MGGNLQRRQPHAQWHRQPGERGSPARRHPGATGDRGCTAGGRRYRPDCLVGYGIGARTQIEGAYPVGWGWGFGYGRGWGWRGGGYYGGYAGWDEPYVYHEGIIAVDLYDAKSKQPIWHASVNQSLYGAIGAEAEQKIDKAVAVIFTKYPHS